MRDGADRRGTAAPIGALGALLVLAAVGLLGLMHLVPPSAAVDPVHRTISEYALLSNGHLFDTALLVLAAGSAVVVGALLVAGLLRPGDPATAALLLWCASLVAVVAFPKHDWSVGWTLRGDLHRVAGLAAFLSLPTGALLLARARRDEPGHGAPAATVVVAAVTALACLAPLVAAVLGEPYTGVAWWHAVPLGALERLIGAGEVATLLALAAWAGRRVGAAAPPGRAPATAGRSGSAPDRP